MEKVMDPALTLPKRDKQGAHKIDQKSYGKENKVEIRF